jgi:DNA polymerase
MSTVGQNKINTDQFSRPVHFIGLDFETYGNVNLPKYGLDRYVSDSSFTWLIASVADGKHEKTWDFVMHPSDSLDMFKKFIVDSLAWGYWFTAHNVGFERAVLAKMGFGDDVLYRVTDSAVVARWAGAASHLEAAAPQLTWLDKMDVGKGLIQLFSVPNEQNEGQPFAPLELRNDPHLWAQWQLFRQYCEADAKASREIVLTYCDEPSFMREHENEWYTYLMNQAGWNTDLALVDEMKLRYEHNTSLLVSQFHTEFGTLPDGTPAFSDKFLNSTPQMKVWCEDRGIKTTSFDAEHLLKLQKAVTSRLGKIKKSDPKWVGYMEVLSLLETKIELGGSSLSKLQKIEDLVSEDGRLRNQYMHCGAGQTYRTTGKGVQMQNLKRLPGVPLNFDDDEIDWDDIDNATLAENLRQVFAADEIGDYLIVGDFAQVESRGLAWVAGDDHKIQAFKDGKDLYKVQASLIYNVGYDYIDKAQRQVGKVGELGCGYGVGPESLVRFAAKMGIEMTVDEALDLVRGWRGTNPKIVELWDKLNEAIRAIVGGSQPSYTVPLAHDLSVKFSITTAPPSLARQHPGAVSVKMSLYGQNGQDWIMDRVFHGCYERGNDICFYKPSDLKTGDLWRNHYRDPKTGQVVFYKLYGGKLTGILVQSMCREMFFDSVKMLFTVFNDTSNVRIIGQFHDELVLSWKSRMQGAKGYKPLSQAEALMAASMSTTRWSFNGFPLKAEIKHDYRYTK